MHNGFRRQLTARDGRLVVEAEVTAIERAGDAWTVRTRAGDWASGIIVNAAGAWADVVAGLAGATPVGLTPKRRTAILIAAPDQFVPEGLARWPATVDVDESFYFKPDAGRLLVSPADATPSEPCDAQPEDLDVAMAVDRLTAAADVTVERILHKRAGLRTFADDNTPVVGYDPEQSGFFWLAGQGGYGIQTSPAMARIAGTPCDGHRDTRRHCRGWRHGRRFVARAVRRLGPDDVGSPADGHRKGGGSVYIGIDLGTSGVKAVIVDDDQVIVGQATASLSVLDATAAMVRAGSGVMVGCHRCGDDQVASRPRRGDGRRTGDRPVGPNARCDAARP